ncbi:MAG: succinate dehydrogenase, hydrophobic membrane anchor protein [Gammaproteobacteria bacterium]|nr:succinate dehydrogenase, hydrophobic membrane anchor protein [Gammaproteobacteria bacterium]MCW8840350.1 succinate dehydrogenase, hydrophobic membrane anchor protein [Gammaproteobacteria bacterium]MCW8927425.1 succinate dehydrogenase, hydrophobic membrane anchor protein [Gammaproteobacteria bacterium]MCW8958708.1 succinate dehydrogenase, hydrophobic membrane anchor protein [Gammaproteobacteria bacterium]MCW8974007.1 succinate dehydrogenase, hydrophobic membrane anchor protein [Gammaproteobac
MNSSLSGLPAWLVQRLSALYMTLFTLFAVVGGWLAAPLDYPAWRALFAHPLVSIATAMFFISLLLHAWVGMRDLILDYAGRSPAIRLMLLALLGGWLIALGLWLARIVLLGVAP